MTVLYLAADPRNEAIIDRGVFWNWAISGLLLLGALLLLGFFLAMLRTGWNAKASSLAPTAARGPS